MGSWAGISNTRPLKWPLVFRPLGLRCLQLLRSLTRPLHLYCSTLHIYLTQTSIPTLSYVSCRTTPSICYIYYTWLMIEHCSKNGYRACLGTSHATHSKSVTAITGLSVSELAHTSLSVSARHDTTRVGSPGVVLGGHAVTC